MGGRGGGGGGGGVGGRGAGGGGGGRASCAFSCRSMVSGVPAAFTNTPTNPQPSDTPSPLLTPLQELGANFDVVDIPAEFAEISAEYREKLVDAVVELDDDVMMAYLDVRGGGVQGFVRE